MRTPSGLRIDSPSWPLLQAHISYFGVTTALGNALGTTLVCANLDNEPRYVGHKIKILSGNSAGQEKTIQIHAAGGIETVDSAFEDNTGAVSQIVTGTQFCILGIAGGGGGGGMPPTAALWMFGIVSPTQVASTTVIDIPHLAGFQDDTFNDDFYMQVLNAGGAAPEGEKKLITDYGGGPGRFTTDAFSADVEAGDIVAIFHTAIEAIDIIARGTIDTSSATVPEDSTRGEGDNFFNGHLFIPTEGTYAGRATRIVDYTGVGGIFTLDPNNPLPGVSGDVDYIIVKGQTEFIPPVDGTNNRTPTDVQGGKADTLITAPDDVSSQVRYLKGILTAIGALGLQYVEGSVADGAPAAADFDTDLAEATNDHYNGMLLMFTDGVCAGQAHVINDYIGAAKNVAFSAEDIWTEAPGNGDNFIILPDVGTMAKAIYTALGTHDTDIKVLLATIAEYIDTEVAAIITSQGRQLFELDSPWSEGLEEVQIGDGAAGATIALPNIVVADLPAGATVVIAKLMFKFRMIENTYAGINKLNGATVATTSQVIQVDDSGATGYVDAINFVDDFFTLADTVREGGDVIIGTVNIAARVDGNDTYSIRWLLGRADSDFINFNDVQVGLRIWYSV